MSEDIRLWEIAAGKKLIEIDKSSLGAMGYKEEDDLETWLSDNIALIDENLLVIGKQVRTIYGKEIDLLCIDRIGNIVIIELKRDRTPREVTAQILDYASWVKELAFDNIHEIANDYLQKKYGKTLDVQFEDTFDDGLPEIVNDKHRMLIVASKMDEETERIIKYLSETYGVDINFIRFQFFKASDGKEFMARVFLIDPVDVEQNVGIKSPSKRSNFSLEVGQYSERELNKLITDSLMRASDLTPRLRKFFEILLSEDKVFNREEVKEKLLRNGIGTDIGNTGRLLSNISQFLTKKNTPHLRQIIEFSSGGAEGQRKDDYKIKSQYRKLLEDVLKGIPTQ